jgi:hypothetical protein
LTLLANAVLRDISSEIIDAQPLMFSVMVDGTRDISGIEQESVCIRYVTKDLAIHEDFIGFHEAIQTTGGAISNIVRDVLLRMELPLQCLRGQTYDKMKNK